MKTHRVMCLIRKLQFYSFAQSILCIFAFSACDAKGGPIKCGKGTVLVGDECLPENSNEAKAALASKTPTTKGKASNKNQDLMKEVTLDAPFIIDGIEFVIGKPKVGPLPKDPKEVEYERAGIPFARLPPEGNFIQFPVKLRNATETKILIVQDLMSDTTLIDEHDNRISPTCDGRFCDDAVEMLIPSGRIRPGNSMNGLLIFAPPIKAAKTLRVESDPGIYVSVGDRMLKNLSESKFTLKFSRSDIQTRHKSEAESRLLEIKKEMDERKPEFENRRKARELKKAMKVYRVVDRCIDKNIDKNIDCHKYGARKFKISRESVNKAVALVGAYKTKLKDKVETVANKGVVGKVDVKIVSPTDLGDYTAHMSLTVVGCPDNGKLPDKSLDFLAVTALKQIATNMPDEVDSFKASLWYDGIICDYHSLGYGATWVRSKNKISLK